MCSLLIPSQESCLLFRILNGSCSQTLDSLKDRISIYISQLFTFRHDTHLILPRTSYNNYNNDDDVVTERKEMLDDDGEPSGAVFNVLDAMLKDSLDRLKGMRDSISLVHTNRIDAVLVTNYNSEMSVIRALCLEGKIGAALCLWSKLVRQFKRIPDLLTHNYIVNALCESGELSRAEWLVKNMLHNGPSPSCSTYNTLMSGYCSVNKVDKALDLFSRMADYYGVRPNRVSCNIVVHALCRKGLLEDARKLFDKILSDDDNEEKLDLVTSTLLMDGYFKNGNKVEALTCVDNVLSSGMKLDIIAYNVMVNGLYLTGEIDLANKILCEMLKRGDVPNVFTYNSVIGNLCKAGMMDDACYIFNVMSRMGVPPNEITFKMIIHGFCIYGDVVKAKEFLFQMLATSIIIPNNKPLIWNVMISAYGKSGDLRSALSLKNQMVDFGVLPNTYTYNALIYAQLRQGNIWEALYLKKEMLSGDVFPDLVTYNLLIGAICNVGNINSALQLHDEILRRGLDPDVITYTELMRGYCRRGDMKKAEEIFWKINRYGVPVDHVPFLLLMKRYFKMKKLDKVFDLYQIWSRREVQE